MIDAYTINDLFLDSGPNTTSFEAPLLFGKCKQDLSSLPSQTKLGTALHSPNLPQTLPEA